MRAWQVSAPPNISTMLKKDIRFHIQIRKLSLDELYSIYFFNIGVGSIHSGISWSEPLLTSCEYAEEGPWKESESQEMEEEDDGEPSSLLDETERQVEPTLNETKINGAEADVEDSAPLLEQVNETFGTRRAHSPEQRLWIH